MKTYTYSMIHSNIIYGVMSQQSTYFITNDEISTIKLATLKVVFNFNGYYPQSGWHLYKVYHYLCATWQMTAHINGLFTCVTMRDFSRRYSSVRAPTIDPLQDNHNKFYYFLISLNPNAYIYLQVLINLFSVCFWNTI